MKRWQRIDGIIRSIETSKFNAAKLTETINNFENNDFRIRLLKQGDLNEETASHGEMSRWGKYLRAPDVYFEILEKCKEKLIPLNKIASLKRGTTSGINDFFYLEKIKIDSQNKMILCRNKRGWEGEIETKYLKNLIKDPSRYENIAITKDNVVEQNLFVFYCNKSKAELKKQAIWDRLNILSGVKDR